MRPIRAPNVAPARIRIASALRRLRIELGIGTCRSRAASSSMPIDGWYAVPLYVNQGETYEWFIAGAI